MDAEIKVHSLQSKAAMQLKAIITCGQSDGQLSKWAQQRLEEIAQEFEARAKSMDTLTSVK